MHQPLRHRRLLPLAWLLLLAACARAPLLPPQSALLPATVELTEVPFFAQSEYQCGPAALASMLTQRGVETSPTLIKEQVYLPGREGSLQVELVAAARAHELLVYPVSPRLEAVLQQVAAGNPVLVLQNLAFAWYPRWHFAVVVGYDRRQGSLVLRSGTSKRWLTDFASFDATWARSGRWAVVTLPADRLPAAAQFLPWLKAASDLEETGHLLAARQAYLTATRRWPEQAMGWFALANNRYASGDRPGAEQALRVSLEHAPGFAAGWFNLSQVLAEQGCATTARSAGICAQRLAPSDKRFTPAPRQLHPQPQPVASECLPLPPCPPADSHAAATP
ncbi:PA2778 family cysteine peptidase [Pseudomonas sp. N040]|uniref:PA2778 family cysteine peptidase n=1 Tax=Pseudomonas sp. N040 TaxID=2785325 RepID=UPI0018A2EC1B|nr:PA2778 family cysteine peptidase [Pseudomonas sp. N040]MBF7729332.1 PA2778 family cysteine peptidase [Pseudomonas sp. N040]MBW7012972.1 PA2778 family cysteine peptidase [Pseudomonas sp. N040]